jgi:15-cis-phytoene synthase
MTMQLYHIVSEAISKEITLSYSTSFSLGIKAMKKKYHAPIYGIYGFVRLADEIVDTFHDYPKEKLLQQFKEQTWQAIREGISTNPVLHSFQRVVNTYNIDHELVEAFLYSMEMDLQQKSHTPNSLSKYIYGSAMVVGLMCLRVFYPNDNIQYNNLQPAAIKLGEAFQKVNFLRDIGNDLNGLGRSYFPGVDFNHFSQQEKDAIINSIKADFEEAYKGVKLLHRDVQLGVYLAYNYYLELLRKIEHTKPERILETRLRVPTLKKLAIALNSWMFYKLNWV